MMELTCAVILILANFVSATPHGYGVKGGAAARAESSAFAGAFGGVGEVPVAVPLGTGYSGSFSKSSSSSSSSSSASSSSSSFSYSGSGAGGFGLNAGCSSGNCQIAGAHGIPASHESSLQGYNSAAKAGAGGLSGSGCQGLNCNSNSEKCASGQCKQGAQPEPNTSTDSDANKCKSGQCGSNLQSASPTEDGPNDIRVVPDSSGSTHDSKEQSHDNNKTPSAYNGAGADCSQGKCGPSSSSKSNYGQDSENSNQSSSASNKQQLSNSNAKINSHYLTPATHLETPKTEPICSSGNCQFEPPTNHPGHETLPSSYNVPIHGSYDNPKKPACDGVKCENQPQTKGTYFSSPQHSLPIDNSVTKGPSAAERPSVTNCGGSNCIELPSSQVIGGPSVTVGPGHINFGQSPTNAPTSGLPNCKTPNCSPIPTYPGITPGSKIPSGSYSKPSDEIKTSKDKLPVYTGGFGGPAGLLNPNNFDATVVSGHPSHVHSSTSQNGAPSGSSPVGCTSPSCTGYPSGPGTIAQPGQPTYGHKPGFEVNIPSEKLPTYTGGFNGPAGMLKPNEFNIPASVTTVPNYSHPPSSLHNTQSPLNNIDTTGCKTANCGGNSPTADAIAGANAQPGYFVTSKPSISISRPSEKLPEYTGGFGGPEGLFKPNAYNNHGTGPSSLSYNPSLTYNTPISSSNTVGCKSGNCFSSTDAANAQAESFGVTKPSLDSQPSSIRLPAFGNNRIPSGVYKPNEINPPAFGPSFTNTQPSSPSSYSSECKTANCAVYPTSVGSPDTAQPGYFGAIAPNTGTNPAAPSLPQYTGSFGGISNPHDQTHLTPAGSVSSNCKSANCANSPTSSGGATPGANAHPGSYSITKPSTDINHSNEKLPTYTGGFGGAPGGLKPNENKPNSNDPIGAPIGESKPVACASGNCNPHMPHGSVPHPHHGAPNGAHATAAAAADANAVAYTGGFGGPPGVLSPYDAGKIGSPTNGGHARYPGSQIEAHHSPNPNNHPAHPGSISGPSGPAGLAGSYGNTGLQAGSVAGSTAYAGSAAGAFSGVHGYKTPGSHYEQTGNLNGGSPCSGSCGGGYNGGSGFDMNGGQGLIKPGYSGGLNGASSTAGASAKSLAGAGTFGLGGSFASSSATAHASAGAYTKGGYGKR